MTCRDFERAWNELIDDEASGAARTEPGDTGLRVNLGKTGKRGNSAVGDRERAIREHVAECPGCSKMEARYQILRGAIREWGPPPSPTKGFAERVLAELQVPTPSVLTIDGSDRRKRSGARVLVVMLAGAVAASLLLAFALPRLNRRLADDAPVVLHATPQERGHSDGSASHGVAVDSRTLNIAWAEATEATWDLARTASEPAARISRQMLDVATAPEVNSEQRVSNKGNESITGTVSVPSLDSLAPDTAAAGALFQQVSDRVATGVRPLSNTARHAFGFLLGPPLPKPEVPTNRPDQKGA